MKKNTIKSQLKTSINIFLINLQNFKIHSINDFSEKLLNLHFSYQKVVNFLKIKNEVRKLENVNLVETFKNKNMNNINLESEKNNDLENKNMNNLEKIDLENKNILKNMNNENNDFSFFNYKSQKCDFSILFHKKYGILKIQTKNIFLNKICMEYYQNEFLKKNKLNFEKQIFISNSLKNEIINKMELFFSIYCDYQTRICDFCLKGNFVNVRKLEIDYVSAYHEECEFKDLQI